MFPFDRKGFEEGQRRYGSIENMACPICRTEKGDALVTHLKDQHGMDDQDAKVVAKDSETRNSDPGYDYEKGTTTAPSRSGGGQKFYEPTRDQGEYAMCECGHEKAMHTQPGGACYGCLCKGMH